MGRWRGGKVEGSLNGLLVHSPWAAMRNVQSLRDREAVPAAVVHRVSYVIGGSARLPALPFRGKRRSIRVRVSFACQPVRGLGISARVRVEQTSTSMQPMGRLQSFCYRPLHTDYRTTIHIQLHHRNTRADIPQSTHANRTNLPLLALRACRSRNLARARFGRWLDSAEGEGPFIIHAKVHGVGPLLQFTTSSCVYANATWFHV